MNPLIIALDVASASEARGIIAAIDYAANFYKVGMELYAAAGMEFVREIKLAGHQVFLDMKFYDIGETVKRAVAQVALAEVDLLTVHGSKEVMAAAVAGRASSPLRLLGVTVLTSFDQTDLTDLGYPCPVETLVELRVKNARDAGLDGVICAPTDLVRVRQILTKDMLAVVPGSRSAGADTGGQKRLATPAEAMRDGANHLVMGRQVTRAADPKAEVERVLHEIRA